MDCRNPGLKRAENIRAEIEYRRRLTEQHLGIRHHFDDHKDSLDDVFAAWIEEQLRWFDLLLPRLGGQAAIRRFLEVGAEKGHIGLHIRNRYGIPGVCVDLSQETFHLATPAVQERMEAAHRPALACADVHALPFRDRSFGLVACFSALHHFYSPDDALAEIRRVLRADGVFFCAWEPMAPIFGAKRAAGSRSEVEFGVYENAYTALQYRRLLRRHFPRVETVFVKGFSTEQDRRQAQASGAKALARRLLPAWMIRLRQALLRGSGNFTAICRMQ
jgi:ubiquinone/menaquinone biosynthesis C-methylase UbiE